MIREWRYFWSSEQTSIDELCEHQLMQGLGPFYLLLNLGSAWLLSPQFYDRSLLLSRFVVHSFFSFFLNFGYESLCTNTSRSPGWCSSGNSWFRYTIYLPIHRSFRNSFIEHFEDCRGIVSGVDPRTDEFTDGKLYSHFFSVNSE